MQAITRAGPAKPGLHILNFGNRQFSSLRIAPRKPSMTAPQSPDPQDKAKLLLHPQRLDILSQLGAGAQSGPALAAALPQVPQASLYRHLALLTKSGIVTTDGTGAQRRYQLQPAMARLGIGDVDGMTEPELTAAFAAFCAALMGRVSRAAAGRTPAEALAAGLRFSQTTALLTEDDLAEIARLVEGVAARSAAPRPGARPYTLAAVVVPAAPDEET